MTYTYKGRYLKQAHGYMYMYIYTSAMLQECSMETRLLDPRQSVSISKDLYIQRKPSSLITIKPKVSPPNADEQPIHDEPSTKHQVHYGKYLIHTIEYPFSFLCFHQSVFCTKTITPTPTHTYTFRLLCSRYTIYHLPICHGRH
jgi:hypothetical protein